MISLDSPYRELVQPIVIDSTAICVNMRIVAVAVHSLRRCLRNLDVSARLHISFDEVICGLIIRRHRTSPSAINIFDPHKLCLRTSGFNHAVYWQCVRVAAKNCQSFSVKGNFTGVCASRHIVSVWPLDHRIVAYRNIRLLARCPVPTDVARYNDEL